MHSLENLVNRYLSGADDDILITDSARSYSRKEFRKKVNLISLQLDEYWSSVPNENRGVAILLERNVEYLALIFASWLAGGFYLPLNLESPKSSINTQIQKSGTSVIVTKENKSKNLNFQQLDIISLDDTEAISAQHCLQNLAYIIYTSGSTGEKKGVAISKDSFESYIDDVRSIWKDKYIANSLIINGELTFDISLADIAFALIFGIEICVTSKATNLLSLCSIIQKRKVESVYAVPTTWELILDLVDKIPDFSISCVKHVFSGGEALTSNLINRIRRRCPAARIYNMYGPTEFTINALYLEIVESEYTTEEATIVPLGKPFPNVKIFVKKQEPHLDQGELYLSGPQLMEGYVNAPAPFEKIEGVNFYPTGDLVRQEPDGLITFIGRLRDYEKISGYRINIVGLELDINVRIEEMCKIVIIEGKLYCIVKREKNTKEGKIISEITYYADTNLEFYERPSKVIFMNEFPVNSSGKLSRQAVLERI